MELENALTLRYLLKDCPTPWINFRKHVSGIWSIRDQFLEWFIAHGYNVRLEEQPDRTYYLVFPNKEEKTRFILTWS